MKYSPEIEAVHKEFMTYSKELVKLAMNGLPDESVKNIQKAERLKAIGFNAVPQVDEAHKAKWKIEVSKKAFEWVKKYAIKYPTLKFITEEGIREICHKYSLVYGPCNLYTGFVPEKNLSEIEKVTIKDEDRPFTTPSHINQHVDILRQRASYRLNDSGDAMKEYIKFQREVIEKEHDKPENYFIAAPAKDMITNGYELKDGYKLEEIKHIPDPVVFCKVHGGALILTAWGDEASDELVVNQKMN